MDQHPHIAEAIRLCGSQPALAEKLGCRQQTVSKMLNLEIPVSAEHALLIEAATECKVAARAIRPDLPWPSPQPSEQGDNQNDAGADQRTAAGAVDVHEVVP